MIVIFQLLYEPIQCIYDSSSLNPTLNDIFVDKEYNENNLDKPLYKPDGNYKKN